MRYRNLAVAVERREKTCACATRHHHHRRTFVASEGSVDATMQVRAAQAFPLELWRAAHPTIPLPDQHRMLRTTRALSTILRQIPLPLLLLLALSTTGVATMIKLFNEGEGVATVLAEVA